MKDKKILFGTFIALLLLLTTGLSYAYFSASISGNEDAKKIISKFETVEFRNGKVQIFDYAIADLMYLYKPRDEGGLNYGKKNFSYSLDNISLSELNISFQAFLLTEASICFSFAFLPFK